MIIKLCTQRGSSLTRLAYTFAEVLIGVAIAGIVFVALYGGMSSGFAVTQLARENLRATQILLERMEGIRLYNWEQLTNTALLPRTFVDYYYPQADGEESRGIAYRGNIHLWQPNLSPPATYANRMQAVMAVVSWTNNSVARQRWIWTYVSKNGVQNYVYYN